MMTQELSPVRPEIGKAVKEIQSHWSAGERARRHRVAEWRQQRLLRMIAPREAYDCLCDTDSNCSADADEETISPIGHRSRRYVVIED